MLVGARTPVQMDEDLAAFETTLDPALIVELNRLTRPLLEKLDVSPDYYETAARSRIR